MFHESLPPLPERLHPSPTLKTVSHAMVLRKTREHLGDETGDVDRRWNVQLGSEGKGKAGKKRTHGKEGKERKKKREEGSYGNSGWISHYLLQIVIFKYTVSLWFSLFVCMWSSSFVFIFLPNYAISLLEWPALLSKSWRVYSLPRTGLLPLNLCTG